MANQTTLIEVGSYTFQAHFTGQIKIELNFTFIND